MALPDVQLADIPQMAYELLNSPNLGPLRAVLSSIAQYEIACNT
jgi:hypothetical protein